MFYQLVYSWPLSVVTAMSINLQVWVKINEITCQTRPSRKHGLIKSVQDNYPSSTHTYITVILLNTWQWAHWLPWVSMAADVGNIIVQETVNNLRKYV